MSGKIRLYNGREPASWKSVNKNKFIRINNRETAANTICFIYVWRDFSELREILDLHPTIYNTKTDLYPPLFKQLEYIYNLYNSNMYSADIYNNITGCFYQIYRYLY